MRPILPHTIKAGHCVYVMFHGYDYFVVMQLEMFCVLSNNREQITFLAAPPDLQTCAVIEESCASY